jgi:hypothetical protein
MNITGAFTWTSLPWTMPHNLYAVILVVDAGSGEHEFKLEANTAHEMVSQPLKAPAWSEDLAMVVVPIERLTLRTPENLNLKVTMDGSLLFETTIICYANQPQEVK